MVHSTNEIKNEAKLHKNNTHFAIHKATNSIAFTWNYKGYDNGELNEFKQDIILFPGVVDQTKYT